MITGRIAYCVIPESGGLFRFYKNLRVALAPHGWEVLAPCLGPDAAKRWDAQFADDGCVLIGRDETDPKRQAMEFAAWVEQEHVDIVMPMDNREAASAVPHLPPSVRLVTRCSSASTFAYKTCMICVERLSRVIAMTPRQVHGLSRFGSLPEQRISMIPHGVDLDSFSYDQKPTVAPPERQLRIVYLGRLDDKTKGTLWLPEIAARLARLRMRFQFDIIGDGEDQAMLARLMKRNGVESQLRLCGIMESGKVAKVLSAYDVMAMPSRIEGFPNALAEAMAAGVVPVASRIRGVTDFIVEDGVTGVLCPIGNAKAFSQAIAGLARDKDRLLAMSKAARNAAEERFSLDRMGRDYNCLFSKVLSESPLAVTPRPWSGFRIERSFNPGWRRYVPQTLKNVARRCVS